MIREAAPTPTGALQRSIIGAGHAVDHGPGKYQPGTVTNHADEYAKPQDILGPFAFGVKRQGAGWQAWALFKPRGRPEARYSARSSSWARDRGDAVASLRVIALRC
jgi:hypothetical protein